MPTSLSCAAAAGLQAPKAAGRGRPSARTGKATSAGHVHVQASDSPPLSRSSSLASQCTGNCNAAKADEVRRTKRCASYRVLLAIRLAFWAVASLKGSRQLPR